MTAVSIRFTSSAAMRKFSAVSSMSASPSLAYGLPCSSVSSRAKSSRLAEIRSAIAWQISARSHADRAPHAGCARRAAATAASTSAGLASGGCGAPASGERPTEERKLATVLFADLVGSTRLADSQDAERTRALLNRFYDAMATEIADAGGTIEKFIGDAVVAAFGAPAAQEHHAARALHAALSMRLRLEAVFGASLRLRIGVNTGDVVAGEAREGSSFVTGDAVNVE